VAVSGYRLHSARGFVTCTPEQYAHLVDLQKTDPVWLTSKDGLRWWWFQDRFWWADERLDAQEVATMVLKQDRALRHRHETYERRRATLTGETGAPAEDPVDEEVRSEVWVRDRGRCVDCGSRANMVFDLILPVSLGGTTTAPNFQLRCRGCQARRRANEVRAAIEKARIGARAAREWGVELTNISWPTAVDTDDRASSA
jgi:5-methylcytosine-specific restriction endonuclease McrA